MTTIEKIRSEIESQRKEVSKKHSEDERSLNYYFGLNDGLKDARDIIDKYASEECDRDCEHCAYLECPKGDSEDAVSRQAVLDAIKRISLGQTDAVKVSMMTEEYVKQLPSVQPKAKTGRWKRISMDKYTTHAQYWYECDKCGEHNLGNTNFCPNCGARMKTVCDHPDKCHECEKILTCTYYKENK